MHDQRKVRSGDISESDRKKLLVEVKQFTALYDDLLDKRQQRMYGVEVLPQLAELLKKNAEAYTMYNYRREVLLDIWHSQEVDGGEQAGDLPVASSVGDVAELAPVKTKLEWLKDELKLSSTILQRDYKVYAAFLHRRWIFTQMRRFAEISLENFGATGTSRSASGDEDQSVKNDTTSDREPPEEVLFWATALYKEKKQGDALLAMDERNFHAWGFRRWAMWQLGEMEKFLTWHSIKLGPNVASVKEGDFASYLNGSSGGGQPHGPQDVLFTPEELKELSFTSAAVRRNFSNYSAWHQRGFIVQGALRRLQQRQWTGGNPGEDKLRVDMVSQAWCRLEEDLALLTTAIYCDPLDQSAWYYAQFLIHASEQLRALPFEVASHVDIAAKLSEVCLDLVGEERRLGEDMETYWPYLHLMTSLLPALKHSNANGVQPNIALAREVRRLMRPNEQCVNSDDDCIKCVQELAAHLRLADPLRAGMYEALLNSVSLT
uniref:Geranylgeranyl transferase type-2 subunit alpha n=1 Tax=Trypanosoma congolense (strain IL3000) TaxID=1068625 RepID=G0UXU0_TRYCI|nr:conserved hypothetical protein [Trypanosoma congolense IL3000]